MDHLRKSVTLVLAAGIVGAISARYSPGQTAAPKQAENARPPFTLTISANQTNETMEDTFDQTVKIASPLVLRIRKTNISDHDIPKWTELWFQFDVRDSSGKPAETIKPHEQYLSGGEDMIVGEKGLGPGEGKILFEHLSGYKLDKPGAYTIQVSEHVSNDPASAVVKSNIITITVIP